MQVSFAGVGGAGTRMVVSHSWWGSCRLVVVLAMLLEMVLMVLMVVLEVVLETLLLWMMVLCECAAKRD